MRLPIVVPTSLENKIATLSFLTKAQKIDFFLVAWY